MWKKLGWVLLGVVVLAIGYFAWSFLGLNFYLPHKRPVLILPIEPQYDSLAGLMPMGEKINHPNTPSGHPGIDFVVEGISEKIPYIASMNGTVSKVRIYDNPFISPDQRAVSLKLVDVVIVNGPYQTVYAELDGDSLPPATRLGAKIKQGGLVGYGNLSTGVVPGTLREMIHWEFGSTSPVIDRFCPLTYFTPESLSRIEAIWAHTDTPEMKARYPKICNGAYDGKAEK